MTTLSNGKAAIIRTERGLTIAGTRITLYDVMDYLKEGWSPKLIRDWLPLTEEQLDAALSYMESHRDEVEAGLAIDSSHHISRKQHGSRSNLHSIESLVERLIERVWRLLIDAGLPARVSSPGNFPP